jgi:hypothetical protein
LKLGVTENAHLKGSREHAPRVNFAPARVRRIILAPSVDDLNDTASAPARLAFVTVAPSVESAEHGTAPSTLQTRVAAIARHLTEDASLFVRCPPTQTAEVRAVVEAAFGADSLQSEIILVGDEARPDPLDRRWTAHHDALLIFARKPAGHCFDAAEARRSGATGSVWTTDPRALYTRLLRVHTAPGDTALGLDGDLRFAEAASAVDRGFVLVVEGRDDAYAAEAKLRAFMPECVHFAPPTPHTVEFDFREVPPSTVVPEGEYPLPTMRSAKVSAADASQDFAPVEAPPSLGPAPETAPARLSPPGATPDRKTPSSRRAKGPKAPRLPEAEQKPSERGVVSSKTRQRREP